MTKNIENWFQNIISFKVKCENKVLVGVTSMALTAERAYFFMERKAQIFIGLKLQVKKWNKQNSNTDK